MLTSSEQGARQTHECIALTPIQASGPSQVSTSCVNTQSDTPSTLVHELRLSIQLTAA